MYVSIMAIISVNIEHSITFIEILSVSSIEKAKLNPYVLYGRGKSCIILSLIKTQIFITMLNIIVAKAIVLITLVSWLFGFTILSSEYAKMYMLNCDSRAYV